MAIDLRGHTVPGGLDHPKRADLERLSLSINATKTVANMVEADQYLASLTAASLPTSAVIIFNQTDQKYYGRISNAWHKVYTTADDISPTDIPLAAGFTAGAVRYWKSGPDVHVTVREIVRNSGTNVGGFTVPIGGPGMEIKPMLYCAGKAPINTWMTAEGEMRAAWVNGDRYSGTFTYRLTP